jgi:pyruvate ferredoxin oxidoreductase gamma subunit
MFEVRIHGRGGQGIRKMAQVLGRAAYLSGYMTQDFPMYGAERRGAPVSSFVRFDKKMISSRGYIFEPDAIIVVDSTIDMKNSLAGIKKDGFVLINSKTKPNIRCRNLYWMDATKIAMDATGKPIPNTVMLGAFARLSGKISLKDMHAAIKKEFEKYPEPVVRKNIEACTKGYGMIIHE